MSIVLPNLKQLPPDIRQSTRAVVWKYRIRDGKSTKVPYQPHRPDECAAVDDPATWNSFATACDAVLGGQADGVGVVLNGDGLVALDYDGCVDAAGVLTPAAQEVVRLINSYTEITPGGRGLRIFARGMLPPGRRVKQGKNHTGIELYENRKYLTVTSRHLEGTPWTIEERTAELATFHAAVFGHAPARPTTPPPPRPVQTTTLDDAVLLVRASTASNGARFSALWAGDVSAYDGDESAADLALCNALAFWTGRDGDQMDRLFRQSGLMRPKWDSRRKESTYGGETIAKAVADCQDTFTPAIQIELEDDAETETAEASIADAVWPTLPDAALIGPFGDYVRTVSPQTEADPVGLLVHGLVLFGNAIGRSPQVAVGDDLHHLNENVLVVGDTSTGRKGMALNAAKALFADVDPDWMTTRVMAGLSSGEGLIYAVRDPQVSDEQEIVDAGVPDKRLTVLETEFAKVLRVSRRENNTLSTILRQCWDDGTLRVLTRNSPLTATGAHVSVVGHITPLELRQELRTTDMASGFINRFLVVLVKRRHLLPVGGQLEEMARARLVARFTAAVSHARRAAVLTRDEDALAHWVEVYAHLTRSRLGLVGAICNRAPAHVLRLSALYALADQTHTIRRQHQQAALAVWEYAEASAMMIFGQRVGHRLANFLLETLRSEPSGLTRTQIRDVLGRHRQADEISEALQLLKDLGLATFITTPANGPGRPTVRWMAEKGAT